MSVTMRKSEVETASGATEASSLIETNGFLDWPELLENAYTTQAGRVAHVESATLEERANPIRRQTQTITEALRERLVVSRLPSTIPQFTTASSFSPLQEWEGYVLEVRPKTFLAQIVDTSENRTEAAYESEISLSELSDDDKTYISPGKIFRWSIGYYRLESGSKKRVSEIVFRRLPAWTISDFKRAEEETNRLLQFLNSTAITTP